jgi:hypothetical protein
MSSAAVEPRTLTCTTCGSEVAVYELPVRFIDPQRFRCLACVDGRHAQLALAAGTPAKVEHRRYDPEQAEIGF